MEQLFPDRITVPPGLVKQRLPFGLLTLTVAILAMLLVGPLMLFGRKAWWGPLVVLPLGIWLTMVCKDDADFLKTASGELKLKQRYR